MTTLTNRLHSITRSLSRSARAESWIAGATFCDGCAQVCTASCRSAARLERSRTTALALSPIR